MGTPFNTEADHTNVGRLFRLLSGSSPAIEPALSLRLRTPPPMRTTSIYSRSDGVVAWQTCRHHKPSVLVHDIEVYGQGRSTAVRRERSLSNRLLSPAA
jgi:hypothetical protein